MSNTVREVFNDYTKGSNILDAVIENVNLYKKTNKLEIDLKTEKKINVGEGCGGVGILIRCWWDTTALLNSLAVSLKVKHIFSNKWK